MIKTATTKESELIGLGLKRRTGKKEVQLTIYGERDIHYISIHASQAITLLVLLQEILNEIHKEEGSVALASLESYKEIG